MLEFDRIRIMIAKMLLVDDEIDLFAELRPFIKRSNHLKGPNQDSLSLIIVQQKLKYRHYRLILDRP